MTPYLKAMYFMALFINASNDFLGYKRAMRVSKKEINKSAMSYFPPASKAERKLRLKASPQNKQQFFKKIKASMIWAFEKYFKKGFRIF